MRKVNLLLILLFISHYLMAQQNGSVKGIALDTLSGQPIASATVSLLEQKDSSLVSFSITDNAGSFEFTNIRNGEYRLLITHVNYHNAGKIFSISSGESNRDLGNIGMTDISRILPEVVVKSEAPPLTIINDTLQYNAGSFKTIPNANVEQLLKKLPGVKVDKDGTIKAQGERVNRVLVDGKEFFGSDPSIATKNLPADAVDKVQVYDRQSDQAQLTGFDDGNYEKTINLKLKKDKKKGMFGKANAGAGSIDRYEGKFNMNSFKGARQFSAIGMGNNTNSDGFSFMDILNFTGEMRRMQRSGGSDININFSDEDASAFGIGGSRNSGIKTVWGGGLNYNNIIGNNIDFQSSYFYNHFNPNPKSFLQRQYFLPGSTYNYEENSITENLNENHRLNLNLLYQPDSLNSIRFIPIISYQKTNNLFRNDYLTRGENKSPANQGFSNYQSGNEGFNFKNDLIYRRKLNRRGRTLSFSLQTSISESNGNANLNSINSFYDPAGYLLHKDTFNQQSNTGADLEGYTARIIFTEPVWKRSLMEFSVSKSSTKNESQKLTYDYNPQSSKHDQLNVLLSNDFKNTYGYKNAGVRMRIQRKKYSYSFGAAWQEALLKGNIINGLKDSVLRKIFYNVLPNARFQYNFSQFKSFRFNYSASTNQPDISQLQPVPDNSNSLNIRQGNPDLKQEFIHNLSANLNLISPYKNKSLFLFINIQATQNKIVNFDSINGLGVKKTTPVNANGIYNINSSGSYGTPVRLFRSNLELSTRINYFKGKQFINGITNNIKSLNFHPEIRLDMNPDNKIAVSLSAALDYSNTRYSIQPSLNTKYFQQEYSFTIDWEMPKRFFLSTEFTYTINTGRATGFNNSVPLLNAGIAKQMLKFNRGELKLSGVDLLNRNIAVSRNSNQNYIEDSRIITLKRFFLLSFTYSLSKTGLNNAGGSGMRMITR